MDQPTGGTSLIVRGYDRLVGALEARLESIARRRAWLAIGTALALVLSLLIGFPRVSLFTGKDPFFVSKPDEILVFWPTIAAQARDPLSTDLALYRQPVMHVGKLAFRLTQPMIQRVLHVGMAGTLFLQMLLGIAMLYLFGRIVEQCYRDRVTALAAVFALSSLFVGKAAFVELTGMGDGFAFACFVIAATLRAWPVVFAGLLVACFSDERAALAGPLIAVYWAIRDGGDAKRLAWLSPRALAAVAGCLVYGAARLYLGHRYGMHTPIGSHYGVSFALWGRNLSVIQYSLPFALSGLWLLVAVAAGLAVRQGAWGLIAVTALLSGAVVAAGLSVFDAARSFAYLLPLLLVAIAAAARFGLDVRNAREIMIVGFAVSFIASLPPSRKFESATSPMPVEIARLIYYTLK